MWREERPCPFLKALVNVNRCGWQNLVCWWNGSLTKSEVGNFQVCYIPVDEWIVRNYEWLPHGVKTVSIPDHKKKKFQNFQLFVALDYFPSLGNPLLPALEAASKEKKRRCYFGRHLRFTLQITTWETYSNFFFRKFCSKPPVLFFLLELPETDGRITWRYMAPVAPGKVAELKSPRIPWAFLMGL